ncbi:leukemia inhibitory factor receptor-like [Eucyclogobius newberryi]|uniref:leukemia inhibitory factor receptor-like n=1 Tax=Eucyclogobius newberryi TaxID=166745 RepID=UPI003B5B4776
MIRLIIRGMLFVFLAFTNHGTGGKHGILQCAPQNMQLSNVSQDLQMEWEIHPSCVLLKNLIFELIVLVEDKQMHHEEVAVMADRMGSSHWWSWKSFLPLECASHSVKIRSRSENQSSPWIIQTLPGLEPLAEIQVFPQDQVFEVGSRATFCCIIPASQTFSEMSLGSYQDAPFNTSMLNNHTYALTVDLLWPTPLSDADIKCKTDMDENGACAIIGYQPSDSNLTCETRDFLSADCFWTVGPQIFTKPTVYWLLEQSCSDQTRGTCTKKVEVEGGERIWTLTARNVLGTIELIDEANLTKRVYMYAPEHVIISSVNAKNANLRWFWAVQRYSLLNLTCQINVNNGATKIIEINGVGLASAVLNDLIPNWTYSAMVRCATVSDFWKWGDWSQPITFDTKGDIPDALDVWMHKEDNQTLIIWKLLEDHQSHGHILDYEVTWIDSEMREQTNKVCVVHPNHSVALKLSSFKKYYVKVFARNAYGASNPSQIIIPSQSQDAKCNTSRISGIKGGFSLSWGASSTASCGYILDWCPMSGDCTVDWHKVPPNKTSATIYSKNFKVGVRYILSIYSCTADAPVLLEMREGYINEQRILDGLFKNLRWEQHASDVKISWDKIALREQSTFIEGYVLYCKNESTVIQYRTADPGASSLTAKQLHITSYTFTVYALTTVGECGLTTLHATLNSQTDALVSTFLIALFMMLPLLLVVTVSCYRHWACIKQKVYPPIPEPVLTGKWLPSKDVVPYCPSEDLDMAVPELHCKFPSSKDGYICQKDSGITNTTTLAQNQTLKKHISCEVILPPTSPMCSRLNVFPNPMYNLVLSGNNDQTGLETNYQDFEEEMLKNYKPQDFIQNGTEADSMSCVSSYIVLPYSP